MICAFELRKLKHIHFNAVRCFAEQIGALQLNSMQGKQMAPLRKTTPLWALAKIQAAVRKQTLNPLFCCP